MAIHPLWPLFVIELLKMGMNAEADLIAKALDSIGWRA
jgi:hypothetical protein